MLQPSEQIGISIRYKVSDIDRIFGKTFQHPVAPDGLACGKTPVCLTVITVKRPDSLAAVEVQKHFPAFHSRKHETVPARTRLKGRIDRIQRIGTGKHVYFQYVADH